MHIYPAAEFAKDENNNLKMKACNGILMLKFGNITDADGVEGVKRSVAMLPSTLLRWKVLMVSRLSYW